MMSTFQSRKLTQDCILLDSLVEFILVIEEIYFVAQLLQYVVEHDFLKLVVCRDGEHGHEPPSVLKVLQKVLMPDH